VARFLLALLAVTPGQWSLSGDERLKQRPFGPLINSLRSMGCNIRCTEQEGCLPVNIEGYLPQRKMVDIDPSASSQFVSAMLLVGPLLPQGLTLTLTDRAASRPYIDMTLAVLNQAGIETSVSANRRVYRVAPLPSGGLKKNLAVSIERDWSSAAFVYAAAALVPGIRLRMPGLSLTNSCQGDKVVAQIFERLGVNTREVRSPYRSNVRSVTVEGTGQHENLLEYNFTDCPDLLPPVLVTCATLGIRARMRGIKNLRLKESDRIDALQKELKAFGADVTLTATELRLPSSRLHGATTVCSHSDHRIAMAFGILTLLFPDLVVQDPEQVTKSFPDFWQQLDTIRKASAQHQAID
jgi:3-phosphoshikimate 1-carboxyvinyltransferase